jgi:hypothetical protein
LLVAFVAIGCCLIPHYEKELLGTPGWCECSRCSGSGCGSGGGETCGAIGNGVDGGGALKELVDGEEVEVEDSSTSYTIKRTGDQYYCTCSAWKLQRLEIPEQSKTCKHIRELRGDAAEAVRLFASATATDAESAQSHEILRRQMRRLIDKGMKQSQMAAAAGVNPVGLSQWLNQKFTRGSGASIAIKLRAWVSDTDTCDGGSGRGAAGGAARGRVHIGAWTVSQ